MSLKVITVRHDAGESSKSRLTMQDKLFAAYKAVLDCEPTRLISGPSCLQASSCSPLYILQGKLRTLPAACPIVRIFILSLSLFRHSSLISLESSVTSLGGHGHSVGVSAT